MSSHPILRYACNSLLTKNNSQNNTKTMGLYTSLFSGGETKDCMPLYRMHIAVYGATVYKSYSLRACLFGCIPFSAEIACLHIFIVQRPFYGGTHVPRLNFTSKYVCILQDVNVACQNFVSNRQLKLVVNSVIFIHSYILSVIFCPVTDHHLSNYG